jgi:transposase
LQTTLGTIKDLLSSSFNIEVSSTTLWRALQRWGFEFGKGIRSAQLKESERIILLRRHYLREKIKNRDGEHSVKRPEIYLDESYINKNHSRDASWFSESDKILKKPTGKGERFIIVNAVSREGWVPNAKFVFKSHKINGDYHDSMNWVIFKDWFESKLIPSLPKNSIIHMDNAKYHNVLAEETFPLRSHTLMNMRYWLLNNKIPYSDDMLKAELFQLCKKNSPRPEFALDKIALKNGHTILRTPPYHPELQPIEICWAVVKGHVAMNNKFSKSNLLEILEDGFNKVGPKTMEGILKKVKKMEDEYWVEDSKLSDPDPEPGPPYLDEEE